MGCSVLLDGLEKGRQLKLGEHDGPVPAECAGQTNDYEAIYVREWEKSQSHVLALPSVRTLSGAVDLLVKGYLHDVRDTVPVGYHDSFLRVY